VTDFQLIDHCKRNLNYLRVSITDRCNLRCMYCVPRDQIPKLTHKDILRYEEILRIVRIGVSMGITKVRVTGGEPLVRKGVDHFLAELTAIEGLQDVSLTTNGVFMKKNLDRIWSAGIRRINVSLDTLTRQKFEKITGFDRFDQVWDGILAAERRGFSPLKINVVALRDVNIVELVKFARLSLTHPFHIRFIEHMPIGASSAAGRPVLAPEIKSIIGSLGDLQPLPITSHDGPAERYRFDGGLGEIGLIRPLSHHFCERCNRLRLTASGQLRPCLLSDQVEDLKTPLRKGLLDEDLRKVFLRAVQHKPSQHHLNGEERDGPSSQMCAIGG